ncbi:hypothetical protein CYY_007025 [Polysphondylium violaceum]|uniref:Uncharacterized protein n=1 Tax=Polysphondylium violaceum TaxID=133409 RepID=A0A8J4PP76_9MYCE|nr:hypothetical protein CYY_007025 [Polysphondylium violaceum]
MIGGILDNVFDTLGGVLDLTTGVVESAPTDLVAFVRKLDPSLTLPQAIELVTTTLQKLTLNRLIDLTVLDTLNKQKDKVRERSDRIFLENIQYHLDTNVLETLKWKKPTLDQDRLAMISGTKVKEWYTKYASLWVVLLTDYELPGKVKSDLIQADMQQMAATKIFTSQMTKIYNYAYLEINPDMAFYMNTAAAWAPLLTDYYQSEEYLEFWIDKVMIQLQDDRLFQFYKDLLASYPIGVKFVDTLQNGNSSLDPICSDIRAKLDILDPTCRSSNKVIGYLQQVALTVHLLEGGLNEKFEENLEQNLSILFNSYLEIENPNPEQSEIIEFIKGLIAISGGQPAGAITTAADIIKSANKANKQNLIAGGYKPKSIKKYHMFEAEMMDSVINDHKLGGELTKLAKYRNMFCGIWRGCQAMVLLLGVVNYDTDAPIMTQVQFVGDSVSLLADFVTAFDSNNKYLTSKFSNFGKLIGRTFSKFTPARLGDFFGKNLTKIFTTSAADFISFRVCPILLLVACYNNILDAKTSIEEKNFPGLVCDLGGLGCNLVSAGILLLGVPYAALAALIIGAVAIGFFLVKIIFFPAKTPIQKYYESSLFPLKYKII